MCEMPELSMDIDRCNSIFELFAAFNFAYAILSTPNGQFKSIPKKKSENKKREKLSLMTLETTYVMDSKSFVDMVDYHLVKPFTLLNEKFDKYRRDIFNLKLSINSRKQLAASNGKESEVQKCEDLITSIQGQEKVLSTCRDRAEKNKAQAKAKLDNKFPYISFLLALFCVSVLVVSASQAKHKHLTLVFLDCALFVTYLCIRIARMLKAQITYWDISIVYMILLGCAVWLHFYIGNTAAKEMPKWISMLQLYDRTDYNRRILIFLNIVIPFMHFIFYLVRFKIQTKIIEIRSNHNLGLLKDMISSSQEELDGLEFEIE